MKKNIFSIALSFGILISIAFTSDSNCDSKLLKKEGIAELSPFFYSASKINTIEYGYKQEVIEIEVPLFRGEQYKMIFNKKALPKDVIIEVYDKPKDKSSRDLLFTSKDVSGDIISYQPTKSKNHYVNYIIPKADGIKESGCLVFILGYQLTFLDN